MNPRARFQPPGMGRGGGGSGSMHPNTNPQHFQNQQTRQWLRRNQLPSADSTSDEIEKTVQSEAVDQRFEAFGDQFRRKGHFRIRILRLE
uniref:DEAD-box ATP-dependent RNA helicase 8-like n=1 Tax=Nicotiana tabacum TaxID=4097 RepID=A0A1S3ZH18_TOBAC